MTKKSLSATEKSDNLRFNQVSGVTVMHPFYT